MISKEAKLIGETGNFKDKELSEERKYYLKLVEETISALKDGKDDLAIQKMQEAGENYVPPEIE